MQNLFSASGINGLYNCTGLSHEIKVDDIHLNITNVTFIAFNTKEYLNPKEGKLILIAPNCTLNIANSSKYNKNAFVFLVTECPANSGGHKPIPSVVGYPYVVINKENVPCIAANMSISIKVPYATKGTSTVRIFRI